MTWQSLTNPTGTSFSEDLNGVITDALLGSDPEERRKRLQYKQSTLRSQIREKLHRTIPQSIEQHIKHGDRLVALGREYLQNPGKVKARLQAERQKRLRTKLYIWAGIFTAVILMLIVSMINGQLNGFEMGALLALAALALCAFENVRQDFG